ncbi:type I polyketide synthase [Urbifossiella limnaea]|uniref:Phenolphthiocerol synthesis polyketide synthase type I Pks15/1 n=1 Tax=Urbifossiella limnaea TaxID=2528023 RepID=A0A517XU70_9BACT|nr:type I polyketide synthase [Urbifossiella limnaea]QDU21056.1 Phenolphthiocerol synthesis polyketide synthase type I Pks15/1 [Urbifossiella limnaea]
MDSSDVLVLTPAASPDPSLAIAAARAGARGTLDLEFASPDFVAPAVERLARLGRGPFGVKLGATAAELLPLVLSAGRPAWVILADGDHTDTTRRLREAGVEVLAEVVSRTEIAAAVAWGVDGVVLKGHEAGGRVGADTAFILVQVWKQYAAKTGVSLPFWVQGGVGAHTAAACLAAGARGVVLDSQLLLTRESPLGDAARKRVAGLDGGETVVLGARHGYAVRLYGRADNAAAQELIRDEERVTDPAAWRAAVRDRVAEGAWLVGQDVALAAGLAAKGVTVAGVVQHVRESAGRLFELSRKAPHLVAGGPLAASHGTRFPILQGPMTRVSDTAAFAAAVATGGALPFLALALLRKAETEALLKETKARLGSKPWGVGVLGFVPAEIRTEQLDAIRVTKPPFAVIAGGRPDQAKELESQGIPTYLHVPSPGLLRQFLKDGARRFIFEGRECGGHVGPRASFALWEAMAEVLTHHLSGGKPADGLHVVFAGGIHDATSTGMVAALSAGLNERGVKVGVLLGTAYLFTTEAVAGGAITDRFQREALACADTVLLETGPGHAIRCIPTPYAETFEAEKRRLRAEGKSPLDVGLALERMNLGRLRVASKGVDRAAGTGLAAVSGDDQFARGMYMIGQVAALRDGVTTVAELHADVCTPPASSFVIRHSSVEEPPAPPPCDVAVVGMSCFYPKAVGAESYWRNILGKTNAVIEIPPTHWDWRPYYDPDPRARDKMVSKWGGFMSDVLFDPLKYGITPRSIPSIEPLQLLLLEAVNQALGDAGYLDRPFARERTCAILGVGGGGMPLSVSYGFRACMPLMESIPGMPVTSDTIIALGEGMLPEWTEDSFPGILLNVAAGRVANRFNLGGPNMAIDAACGSSLAALYAGVRELQDGTSDVAIVMGGDAVQTPYAYVAFSKTHALSPKGRCRPFDADADGIALAEGVGVAVLKRLADAERDGDRIYSVIKGVGASSDGRDKGLTAPRAEGQLRALHRAYAQARVNPANVGLVEAHGTGTVVGDQTEARAIGQLLRDAGADAQSCAIGSVKSMIGHSKCAAGLAGLIKTAYALHYKVLPPTLVEKPNPKANLDGGPLYLNTEARPWVHGAAHPRTAGVSAFGFGGTNFHTVLEEYTGDYLDRPESGLRAWPAELFVWRRPDRAGLITAVTHCRDALAAGAEPALADLAASVWQASRAGVGQPTLAVVAASLAELKERLGVALDLLAKKEDAASDPRGVTFNAKPQAASVAFLFPGQGSQYPDMLAQPAMAFSEVRQVLDTADRVLGGRLEKPLGRFVFPPSPFGPEQEAHNRTELQRTEVAQPAIGAASLGMARLLSALGVEADVLAGHSYGEYAALAAAGALTDDDFLALSYERGRVIRDAAGSAAGGMLAADATPAVLDPLLTGVEGVWVANHNSPHQTVLAGTDAGLAAAAAKLDAAKVRHQRIPVACGFHSPLIAAAKQPLATALAAAEWSAPRKPVYSNTTAAPHGTDPSKLLAEHLVSPVKFADEVEAMYAAGARVFVEVGPGAVLTGLAGQVLAGKPHVAVATDQKGRPGLVQLCHALAHLLAAGVPVQLDRLFQGRGVKPFDASKLSADTGKPKPPATAWVVNGVRSRPVNGPEPRLLGQALPPRAEPPARTLEVPKSVPAAPTAKPAPPPATPRDATPTPRAPMHTPTPPTLLPAATGPLPDGAAQVMARFQDVMAKFLDTQRSVMLGYFGGAPLPAPSANGHAAAPAPVLPPPIAARLAPPAPARPIAPPPVAVVPAPAASGKYETNGKHEAIGKYEPAPAKPAAPALDRDALVARLLDLVSDRTGYPKEALSIDLDLEADLGVDSIKRVEVLGALAEGIEAAAGDSPPNLEMEKLSVIKTIRGIADYVAGALADAAPAASPSAVPAPSANGKHDAPAEPRPGTRSSDVQRLVVRLVDAPLPARPRFAPPAGTLVITDDRLGTARELADRLAELDVNTVLLRMAEPGEAASASAADLTDPAAVEGVLARVREKCGPIAGLVHLLPLAEAPEGEAPSARASREVKSLYLLARGLETDIRAAGKAGSAVLLAVTGMGGRMGYGGELPAAFSPTHGGVAGFAKCLGYEWPEATVRVVDVDPEVPAPRLVEQLLAELGDPDGPLEVGRDGDDRVTWQVEPGPLDTDTPVVDLGPTDTVLVTGGARGITAKIALEIAARYRSRLVLVGSSPAPADEPADTVKLTTPAEIKAALLKRTPGAKPAAVEAEFKRLVKDREIRGNLDAIRAAGSAVEYRSVDVRDAAAFAALIAEVQPTGVIHGAGVIEDKLLKDKTPESFDRVFGTKVESAFTLARTLDPARTKFLSLYASITSRYGNRGQSDYAAANEVLSKLACQLDAEWPGRVVSVAWGPWAEVGMVADLEKHLVARGLKLIAPAVGARFAVDEVVYGGKGEAEVVVAGGTEHAGRPGQAAPAELATVGAE